MLEIRFCPNCIHELDGDCFEIYSAICWNFVFERNPIAFLSAKYTPILRTLEINDFIVTTDIGEFLTAKPLHGKFTNDDEYYFCRGDHFEMYM